jgi:hypothetical protein
MKAGTFSYDFEMFIESPESIIESSGSIAMDGGNIAMSTQLTVEGMTVRSKTIQLDGIAYIIDHENKTILEADIGENFAGFMDDYSDMVLVGSGTGEIRGRTLPYEEYLEDEFGSTVKYFIDGGQVYGTISEADDLIITTLIINPRNSVPADAFTLPADYTRVGGSASFNPGSINPDSSGPIDFNFNDGGSITIDLGDFNFGDLNLGDLDLSALLP